jgi:SAM-dependent methyltransferase
MKSPFLLIRFSFILFSALSSQSLFSQEFVPEVGQRGKDVVWVPTPGDLVSTMLDLAKVTSSDVLVDLGSGDGRTVIAAAKRGAQAVGIEYNPDMVKLSVNNAKKEGVSDKAKFLNMDLYEYDLSNATVVTMFLLPEINLKLRPRLLDLKPGTRVVSNTFTMGEWEPDKEVETNDNTHSWTTALLWIIPAKVDGTWKLGQGELKLTQDFQKINGTLTSGSKAATIRDGKLNGTEIRFMADGKTYTGTVKGNSMSGTVTSGGSTSNWSATR